jgi:hypothetical protein
MVSPSQGGPSRIHPSRPLATVVANSIRVNGLAEITCRLTPPVATTGNVVSLPCDRSAASTLARSKVTSGVSVAATSDVALD